MKHFTAAMTVCLICIVCSVGIQHGDISPEHVMRFVVANGEYDYILIDWGHAVLEERYSPAISPEFSSTSALHEGRLCPASDTESLIYLLSFVSGCAIPEFDSMEAALRWRNRVWAWRAIQQQLGEVSAVLKAFADYVDGLCTAPYPDDYDIWLQPLNWALPHGDPRRMNDLSFRGSDFALESSGTPSVIWGNTQLVHSQWLVAELDLELQVSCLDTTSQCNSSIWNYTICDALCGRLNWHIKRPLNLAKTNGGFFPRYECGRWNSPNPAQWQ